MKTPPKHLMGWTTQAMLQLRVTSRGRLLQVALVPVPDSVMWSVVALEAGLEAKGVEGVFADHAHKSLGEQPGMRAAIECAEAYAAKWQRAPKKSEERCACPELEPARAAWTPPEEKPLTGVKVAPLALCTGVGEPHDWEAIRSATKTAWGYCNECGAMQPPTMKPRSEWPAAKPTGEERAPCKSNSEMGPSSSASRPRASSRRARGS